jgi:hypothetical protein
MDFVINNNNNNNNILETKEKIPKRKPLTKHIKKIKK